MPNAIDKTRGRRKTCSQAKFVGCEIISQVNKAGCLLSARGDLCCRALSAPALILKISTSAFDYYGEQRFTLAGWSFHVNDILIFMGRRSGAKSPDAKPLEIAGAVRVRERARSSSPWPLCSGIDRHQVFSCTWQLSSAFLQPFLQTSPLCCKLVAIILRIKMRKVIKI